MIRKTMSQDSAKVFHAELKFGSTTPAATAVKLTLTLVALSVFLAVSTRPADAQSESVLYTFTGKTDGLYPAAGLISDGAGNLYGTTILGGQGCWSNPSGCGVVFEISPNGSGGWNQTVLHSFSGPPDPANSWAPVIFDKAGNLYGTTGYGGPTNYGAIFELSPAGTSWTEKVLYNYPYGPYFPAFPNTALVMDAAGNLYCSAAHGGSLGAGTLLKLTPAGDATVLHTFGEPGDGSGTQSMVLDSQGNLYGTTNGGGAYGGGTLFELTPSGAYTLLYSFGGQPEDSNGPGYLVMNTDGDLYSVAWGGGAHGNGTVFKITTTGVETVLYSFGSQPGDGANPTAGPAFDQNGNLYGETYVGGANNKGTVFKLTPTGVETVLYSFGSQPGDGFNPQGTPALDGQGNLYGITGVGGAYGAGTVFEIQNGKATTTTLSSAPNPSHVGETVNFTATVTSTAGTPTGTVLLYYGSNPIGSGTLTNSTTTIPVSTLPAGSDSITAKYQGNSTYGASTSSPLIQVVNALTTATAVSSSLNPSVYGQSVIFTATVTSSGGTPTGIVIFYDGTSSIGSGTLSAAGQTSVSVNYLPAGKNSITGVYQGSSTFAGSTSNPLTQTVNTATTATSLTSSLNHAATNQPVTFNATVTGQYGGAVSGTVTFYSGSQSLGSATLSGNVASLTTSFATAGTYSISAKYSGDANNIGSSSGTLNEKIIASTTTRLTSSLNPSFPGQAVTFTATVTSSSGAPPNGETITFYNGTSVLGTAPLSAGVAAITTSSLPAGVYTITASYPGDTNFASSTSPALRQVVNSTTKSATSTTLASGLNPAIYGQSVTFTASVTTTGSLPPTGKVTFQWQYFTETFTIGSAMLNSSGIATLTTSKLNTDAYPMTAVYAGDTNNLGSTSPVLNQTVLQTTSAATISSSLNPSAQGQAVIFTAKITSPTVTPTGPVTFKAGTTVLGTVQLSGGKASYTTASLPAGSTVIKVTYNGDSNIKGSSAAVTQVVQP